MTKLRLKDLIKQATHHQLSLVKIKRNEAKEIKDNIVDVENKSVKDTDQVSKIDKKNTDNEDKPKEN